MGCRMLMCFQKRPHQSVKQRPHPEPHYNDKGAHDLFLPLPSKELHIACEVFAQDLIIQGEGAVGALLASKCCCRRG